MNNYTDATKFEEVETRSLTGDALDWARHQPIETDQPKTFGCHHNGPTCSGCHDMVMRWLVRELGESTLIPSIYCKEPH